ncbi:LysR family transcriptional regulator [Sphingobium sp. HBC34]|uniref:LysR family transcriptional regulator n=1 Tax=Sphingobium cyanobacteriorum TaxID=3063954 RepID=A0ABT8ZIN9_9SPHN|nr:LysR family transcriptional regulator [Sphingobium sp. HBC34]MDO7834407.1 LysR family transcriptional regulator [Sphingobium sp. HBC34]
MNSPSLRQLDIFARMVAAGDAARCARDLGVAVEQVLHDIAALEMRLGYPLFDDPGGDARLTPAGHKTAQAMTLLSQDRPGAERAASGAAPPPSPPIPAGPERQSIMLAAPAPIFGHFQDALAAFEAANEDIAITLDLHVHSAQQAMAALASGRADIAYFYGLEEPAGIESRYGWSEPLNLYAGTSHPLAHTDSVSREALAITPMLTMEPQNGMREIVDAALAKGRLRTLPALLESDNMFEIIAALRDGVGYFAAFGTLARDLGRMGGIQRLALDMPLPAIEIRQAVAPGAVGKPAVGALADFLFL